MGVSPMRCDMAGTAMLREIMALKFHYKQLPNGLDIVAEDNPDSHSFAAGLFVKTGSRDEDSTINGVLHLLEHIKVKSSGEYTSENGQRIFYKIRGRHNTFTPPGMT